MDVGDLRTYVVPEDGAAARATAAVWLTLRTCCRWDPPSVGTAAAMTRTRRRAAVAAPPTRVARAASAHRARAAVRHTAVAIVARRLPGLLSRSQARCRRCPSGLSPLMHSSRAVALLRPLPSPSVASSAASSSASSSAASSIDLPSVCVVALSSVRCVVVPCVVVCCCVVVLCCVVVCCCVVVRCVVVRCVVVLCCVVVRGVGLLVALSSVRGVVSRPSLRLRRRPRRRRPRRRRFDSSG